MGKEKRQNRGKRLEMAQKIPPSDLAKQNTL